MSESMMPSDPVELEIFKHLFASIAEEMGGRLMRSAYSPNIKERRDFSCAVFDADARMIAQAAHIPVHLGSTPMSVEAVLQVFPAAEMKEGDCFVLNDPFAGGTHLPDITVVAPCLLPGESTPRFFVANRAHHADVGGLTPGSMPLSRDISEEGVRISPRRLDDACIEWICSQSRTPDERRGDLLAQTAALHIGKRRMLELCERYSAENVSAQALALQAYTERLIRRVIEDIPDGEYTFEDRLDGDGFEAEDIRIHVRLEIRGSRAVVDFTAADDQVAGPVNAVRAIAISAVNYVFQCLAPDDIPSNAGVMGPIEVETRPGSIVDALPPAAVAGGNVETSQRIVDVLFGALSKALPSVIPAASCGSMNNITLGGFDSRRGRPFAYYETLAGGAGGGPSGPGASAVHTHMTNTLNTPVEALELSYPFRIEHYKVHSGSGGRGYHAGGDGVRRCYVFDSEALAEQPLELTLLTERRKHAPYGVQGGEPGMRGQNILYVPGGSGGENLPSKCTLQLQTPSTKLEIVTPGGGGWGVDASTDGLQVRGHADAESSPCSDRIEQETKRS